MKSLTERIQAYDASLTQSLGDRIATIDETPHPDDEEYLTPDFEPYEDATQGDMSMPETDEMQHDLYDKYISAKLILPDSDGNNRVGEVKRRKKDGEGNFIGRSHANPLLDGSVYEVEYEDGSVGTYAANIIAENIFAQVDTEGRSHLILDSITDHNKSSKAQ